MSVRLLASPVTESAYVDQAATIRCLCGVRPAPVRVHMHGHLAWPHRWQKAVEVSDEAAQVKHDSIGQASELIAQLGFSMQWLQHATAACSRFATHSRVSRIALQVHAPRGQRAAGSCQDSDTISLSRCSSLQYSSQKGLLTASRWSTDAVARLLLSSGENITGLALALISSIKLTRLEIIDAGQCRRIVFLHTIVS